MLAMVLLISGLSLHSQMIIIPEVQTSGIVMKQQLWSLMINNLSGTIKKAVLSVSVIDRISSQILMQASSNIIIINPGVKRVTYQELSPVSYTISVMGFSADRALSQPLPVGEYLVCYKLLDSDRENDGLASECVKVFAEPLSPPQLIQPENESVIAEPRPVLTWTPPAPVYIFNSLSYDIIVSPLYEKQSPEEALQRNIPVMTISLANNSLLYPSSYTNLETGKTYVWQVVAKDAGRFGGKSEVWKFTVMPDSVAEIISAAPYIKLKKQNNEATILHQGVLKMEYFNASVDSAVHAEVYRVSETNNKRKQKLSFELRVKRGQNFLEYNINNKIRLDEEAVYEVKLYNSSKESWYMKFTPRYYF
jgi:hypothetical protein